MENWNRMHNAADFCMYACMLRAYFSQSVRYWYEICDVLVPFLTCCEEWVPILHSLKFAFLHCTHHWPLCGSKGETVFCCKWSCCISNSREWNVRPHTIEYFALTHTHDSSDRVKRSKHFFLTVAMLHIKLKRMKHRTKKKHEFWPYAHTDRPWV